jgi:hypothetical protein
MNSFIKKSLLTLIALVFIGFSAQSQVSMNAADLKTDWSLLTEKDGIKMYIKKGECQMSNDPNKPFTYGWIKVENTNSSAKYVEFHFNVLYADGCAGCDSHANEYKTVSIPANTTLTTDCEFKTPELGLLIHNPYQLNLQEFKSLTLTDLKVD